MRPGGTGVWCPAVPIPRCERAFRAILEPLHPGGRARAGGTLGLMSLGWERFWNWESSWKGRRDGAVLDPDSPGHGVIPKNNQRVEDSGRTAGNMPKWRVPGEAKGRRVFGGCSRGERGLKLSLRASQAPRIPSSRSRRATRPTTRNPSASATPTRASRDGTTSGRGHR